MYKFERYRQLGLAYFTQPVELKMNPKNRWVKHTETITWDAIKEKYAKLFPSKNRLPTKPLKVALGSLPIQKRLGFSDWELVEGITKIHIFSISSGYPDISQNLPLYHHFL